MRTEALANVKVGINRLRDKGGANPSALFDQVNCEVTQAQTIRPRGGTTHRIRLPEGTKGLCVFQDKLVVFASEPVAIPDAEFDCQVLIHPGGGNQQLEKIHFSAPFLGVLYVAAEFDDGSCYHYWLRNPAQWAAATIYLDGQIVQPTTPNGFIYRATRLAAARVGWAPGVPRTVGDEIEPLTYNGYFYTVIDTVGATAASGQVEPAWPAADGATINEDTDSALVPVNPNPPPGTPPANPPSGGDDGSGYCVVESSWLSDRQAIDMAAGVMADCHDPERGFFRSPALTVGLRVLQPCVRLTTSSGAWLEVSRSTPVNFASARYDAEPGHHALAPDILDQTIIVEGDPERVVRIDDIGMQWVVPIDFGGLSFGASGTRHGRRIYTHNMGKFIP